MPMHRSNLQRMVEIAIAVALVAVLSNIRVYKLPQGGSITAGSLVPIFYVALRWGGRAGILAGVLAGVVNYILEPYFVHPVQVLLDYPVAFGALGLAGFFPRRPVAGIVVGGLGRFLAHFLSGIVFFASYAPAGTSPAVYSAVYNGSYMLPETVISVVLTLLVVRAMERIRPVQVA
jgi:thiamine transporter